MELEPRSKVVGYVATAESRHVDGHVAEKYRGSAADRREMEMMGKQQVLRRNFHFATMFGFASMVIASWEMLLEFFVFSLYASGTAILFWGFIIVALGQTMVYASIAEMASMSPTAGGQYHWVSEFAPLKVQKLLSYVTGWLIAIGWQVYLTGVCFMVGLIIQGLIAFNDASYDFHNYHGTLLAIAVIIFAIVFNTVLAQRLPMMEGLIVVLHILGFFAIIIPLWIMAPRTKPEIALLEFTNNGGWSTTGLAAMVGLNGPLSVLIGYDCSVHMSEEINDASITLPKSIMWSVVLNASLAFVMAITLIFTIGDIDAVLATPTGQPFIQIIFNATQSIPATNTMVLIVIILLTSCAVSELATASRQIWSFARDRGLPGSNWLAHVSPGWNIPLRAVLVSLVVTSLLACINLGSSVALNAINSLGSVAVLTSYFVSIACLVSRRLQGPTLPPRRWSLGKYGMAVNVAALLFLAPIIVVSVWPLENPVTPETMNWSSTMFGGLLIVALVYYVLRARHWYTGPVMQIKRDC